MAWLGLTVPLGLRLKNRISEPWHSAYPNSEPPDDITESPLSAVHPPTTVWAALNGRTAAPTAVVDIVTAITATTAATTTKSVRRSMGYLHPAGPSPGANPEARTSLPHLSDVDLTPRVESSTGRGREPAGAERIRFG